jgi:hypothetical protein
MILIAALLLLSVPAVLGAVLAVRSDGYDSHPGRYDPYVDLRRLL